ncbi:hypothetical protein HELRODRAFT_94619 [Helobdella robusta]|uniref:Uncharacterized protein n=1 Tax=Helobdella robusta TaxID=6412 RepID=T1G920_HELRO|nr:hypothetical protein HELRODRAFT_94619 [Helobdella robusta]ESO02521.1 hypothetical protein HELRODRAFT_94619 [Helobdella robusta]
MALPENILIFIKAAKSQSHELIKSSSLFVKCLWIFMIIGYLLSYSHFLYHNTVISAAEIFPPNFKIWTLFTHAFVEIHFWTLLCNLVVAFLYGQLLEPLWGGLEMYKFILINTFAPAIFAVFVFTVRSLTRQEAEYLFEYHIYGFSGSVAGFCVAVKQVMPEPVLFTFPNCKFQNRHIPLVLLFLVYLASVIGIVELTYPVLFTFGLLNSWVYLRFYQKHGNGYQGDSAEKFSLASFFPVLLQPVLKVPSNAIFSFLVTLKLCKKNPSSTSIFTSAPSSPTSPHVLVTGSNTNTVVLNLPGTEPNDAFRQKQMALKALNSRLVRSDVMNMHGAVDSHSQQSFSQQQQQQQQQQEEELPRSRSFDHLIKFSDGTEFVSKSVK